MTTTSRTGVFGGTFDPVHIGHLIVADVVRHHLSLDRVIFLPAGRPPHKPGQALSNDDDRLAMLRLAIVETPQFALSTLDIDRPGASYTADSLGLLRESLEGDITLWFLMGQDSLRDFPTWNRPDEIVEQARLAVALRPGVKVDTREVVAAVPATDGRIDIVPVPLIGVSSRDVRATVRAGGPFRYQVMPAVADYILERRLYLD